MRDDEVEPPDVKDVAGTAVAATRTRGHPRRDVPAAGRLARVRHWMRQQLTVRTLFPLLVTLGLLAYVADIASARHSAAQLWTILQQAWWVVALLTVPYLAARILVWHNLLCEEGIHPSHRQLAVSFAAGEISKSLPAGVYVQNYLLARLAQFNELSIVRSSMATTATLGLEAAVALPVALVVRIPGWGWLRWSLAGVVLAWLAALLGVCMVLRLWQPGWNTRAPGWLRAGHRLVTEFLDAGRDLLTFQTVKQLVPTATYMTFYVIYLYVIARALGVTRVSFLDMMAIYAIVVLAVILIPIPTELGITEFTGLGVFAAFGVTRSTAAIIMLSLRILATGMTIAVASVLIFVLRSELRHVRSASPEPTTSIESPAV